MAGKPGRRAIIEQFLADGFTYMFGNPGTVEQGFLDAISNYPQFKYILTLQESVAVLMADGYARASQRPALVQIHSTPGLGNAIGALYQAKRGHSPLVVIGGDAGIRYFNMDSQMAGDLVAMAEPVTKWATLVTHPASLLRTLRRAIKIAATPPMGPVYLCLPMDVLDALCLEEVRPTSMPSTKILPDPALIKDMAVLLAKAKQPMIFVGDGVAFSKAQAEVVALAELLGAEVWDVDAGEVNISHCHPLYQGMTGHMFGSHSLAITKKGDVNLICGTYMLPEVFPELGNVFAQRAKNIHIDLNAYEIAKNHPVDIGVVSDPQLTLRALRDKLKVIMTAKQKQAAKLRGKKVAKRKQVQRQKALAEDAKNTNAFPLPMASFMAEFVKHLPAGAIVFDESLTNGPALERYLQPEKAGQYFLTRGGSLGVGFPGAIGVKLAQAGKTVVGFSGDGGSLYTIQALWTAVRHQINAKFVVCNNRSYRLLQSNIGQYWQAQGIKEHAFPLCFDLSKPQIDFVTMARSMGVEGVRVEKPHDIAPAIKKMFAAQTPFLIDLFLEGDVQPKMIGVKCGQ